MSNPYRSVGRCLTLLGGVLNHPLNRDHRCATLARVIWWQAWKRFVRRPLTVDYWNGLSLKVYPDWPHAGIAVYVKLTEYDDMMFVLRYLRPGDGFIDVGANIGLYSLLASSVSSGGTVLAYEPHPVAAARLKENLACNSLDNVVVRAVAVGDRDGSARLTSDLYDRNRIVTESDDHEPAVNVVMTTLDRELAEQSVEASRVGLVKVDAEGFEAMVVGGARDLLREDPGPVWIVEVIGLGEQYGRPDLTVHELFGRYGYQPHRYYAGENVLVQDGTSRAERGNLIFARDPERVRARLQDVTSVVHSRPTECTA